MCRELPVKSAAGVISTFFFQERSVLPVVYEKVKSPEAARELGRATRQSAHYGVADQQRILVVPDALPVVLVLLPVVLLVEPVRHRRGKVHVLAASLFHGPAGKLQLFAKCEFPVVGGEVETPTWCLPAKAEVEATQK